LLRSNRKVSYAGKEFCIDTLSKGIDTIERNIEDATYHIWIKKLPVCQRGDGKLIIAEKDADEDEENPVKYLVTNKVDPPTEHIIRSYGVCWRLEIFFANLKHLKEAVYNLFSWIWDKDDRGVDNLMNEINQLFIYSTADANVQS
jgi:hypothetical protein